MANTPATFAQKGGHGGGGHSGGHSASAGHAGTYHGGSAYHNGSWNGHHDDHHHHGGVGFGIYLGYPYWGGGYGYGGYPYYSNGYDSAYYMPYTPDYAPAYSDTQSFYFPPAANGAANGAPNGPVANVAINDGSISPTQLDIKSGTTVRFTNIGVGPHALAQPQNNWQSQSLSSGKTYTWTFREPGTYTIQDAGNPNAKIVVVVE
jgi:plastocyanin